METTIVRTTTLAALAAKQDCWTHHFKTFTAWLGDRPLDGLRGLLDVVPDYFRDLNASDYSASTIGNKRQAVKNRLRLLVDSSAMDPTMAFVVEQFLKRLDRDPETKAPKIQAAAIGPSKIMSEVEYGAVYASGRSERNRLFLEFLWRTGCRVSELCSVKIGACRRDGSAVRIRIIGKGRKERILRIPGDLYDRIRETFGGEEWLFETRSGRPYRRQYVSDKIARMTLKVLGRRLSAHKMRHSFATRMLATAGKLQAVSQYLGHSSTAITADLYVHETLTDGELFA